MPFPELYRLYIAFANRTDMEIWTRQSIAYKGAIETSRWPVHFVCKYSLTYLLTKENSLTVGSMKLSTVRELSKVKVLVTDLRPFLPHPLRPSKHSRPRP